MPAKLIIARTDSVVSSLPFTIGFADGLAGTPRIGTGKHVWLDSPDERIPPIHRGHGRKALRVANGYGTASVRYALRREEEGKSEEG